jgi:hypothetical protein
MPFSSQREDRPIHLLLAVLVAGTLALLFLFRSVDVPIYDAWELVPLLNAWDQGTLTSGQLWQQHNEHRPLVPRVVLLSLARFTNWNVYWELALNGLLSFTLAVMAGPWLARKHGVSAWTGCIIFALFLSPAQWQNYLLGWQVQLWLSMVCGVGALLLLLGERLCGLRIAAALFFALVSAFSFASGLVWLVLVGMNVLAKVHDRQAKIIVLLSVATGLITYFYGFHLPEQHTDRPGLFAFLLYLCVWLGQPVAPYSLMLSSAIGSVGIALFALYLYLFILSPERSQVTRALIALAAFSLLSACLAAWARGALGPEQALSSRYITLANPFWAALLIIGTVHATPSWRRGGLSVAAILIVLSFIYGAYRWDERYDAYSKAREALIVGTEDPALRFLYPEMETLLERRALLEEKQWSVFRP